MREARTRGQRSTGTFFAGPADGLLPLDLTDPRSTRDAVVRSSPSVVALAAAMTSVDGCEARPDLAEKVNAIAPREVAEACRVVGAQLVHISTDYVFDGREGPSDEEREPNPLSVYGKTKLEGERNVLRILPEALVLRTSANFGWNRVRGRENTVTWILNRLRRGEPVPLVREQRDRFPPPEPVQNPRHRVLPAPQSVPSEVRRGSQDERLREDSEHVPLPLELRLAIHAERVRLPLLVRGSRATVEDIVRGDVDEVGANRAARLRNLTWGDRVHPFREIGSSLAPVDTRHGGREGDDGWAAPDDRIAGRSRVREVEREEAVGRASEERTRRALSSRPGLPHQVLTEETSAPDHEDVPHGAMNHGEDESLWLTTAMGLSSRRGYSRPWRGSSSRAGPASSDRILSARHAGKGTTSPSWTSLRMRGTSRTCGTSSMASGSRSRRGTCAIPGRCGKPFTGAMRSSTSPRRPTSTDPSSRRGPSSGRTSSGPMSCSRRRGGRASTAWCSCRPTRCTGRAGHVPRGRTH